MRAKQVIIFGAGPTGVRVFDKYKELVDIVAVTDNDETNWGVHWGGDRCCFTGGCYVLEI